MKNIETEVIINYFKLVKYFNYYNLEMLCGFDSTNHTQISHCLIIIIAVGLALDTGIKIQSKLYCLP